MRKTQKQQYKEYLSNGGSMSLSEWIQDGKYNAGNEPIYQAPEQSRCITDLFNISTERSEVLMSAAKNVLLNTEKTTPMFNAIMAIAEDINEALFLSAIAVSIIKDYGIASALVQTIKPKYPKTFVMGEA